MPPGGIVHRDIKPENLLLDKAGRVKAFHASSLQLKYFTEYDAQQFLLAAWPFRRHWRRRVPNIITDSQNYHPRCLARAKITTGTGFTRRRGDTARRSRNQKKIAAWNSPENDESF
jgi:serine/threonine protein kinase